MSLLSCEGMILVLFALLEVYETRDECKVISKSKSCSSHCSRNLLELLYVLIDLSK